MKEKNMYLRAYESALEQSKWWWSEQRIQRLVIIYLSLEINNRLNILEAQNSLAK